VRFHRLLREEEAVADLAVDEPVGDQLENLDLARSWLLLQLLERAGERNDLGSTRATLGDRIEPSAVIDVAGENLLALSSVHGNRGYRPGRGAALAGRPTPFQGCRSTRSRFAPTKNSFQNDAAPCPVKKGAADQPPLGKSLD
jgi:hypothetical protein